MIVVLLRYWKEIALGAIILVLTVALFFANRSTEHYKKLYVAEHAAFEKTVASYRTMYEVAKNANITDVRDTEAATSVITEDKQHDLETQLAAARAAVDGAQRVRRCPTAADPGRGGEAGKGEAPGTPGGAGDTRGMSLVPDSDLRICADNTVKAKGWQDWYGSVRERMNAD